MSAVMVTNGDRSVGDVASSKSGASQNLEFAGAYRWNNSFESAIRAENVWKQYDKQHHVLKNFNMNVPKGSIYSLLGSSGCGKTTILSCVVGRQTWDAGTISVLGSSPATKRCTFAECGKIGYMPQELALQERLTIRELIQLYGRLSGMSHADILARFQFLVKFLQLPKEDRILENLSGGQKRRASLAIALLHEPDLIILDEPTVGLDPLLRQSIWQHLQDLVVNLQVTIIMTTHYIDEARRSHVVGLMRHGRIISEESPQVLMRQYECSNLDQIVLQICKRDETTKTISVLNRKNISNNYNSQQEPRKLFYAKGKLGKENDKVMDIEEKNVRSLKYRYSLEPEEVISIRCQDPNFAGCSDRGAMWRDESRRKRGSNSSIMLKRFGGLMWAAYLTFLRHPGFIPVGILMPPITAALTEYVFRSDLHDLKFGYIMNDVSPGNLLASINESEQLHEAHCLESKFGQVFLDKIPTESLILIPFLDQSDALKAAQAGDIWGFLSLPSNFTEYMHERMLARNFADAETIDGTTIEIHLDMSSFLGSIMVLKKLFVAYQSFLNELATSCGLPTEELEIPLRYRSVFDNTSDSYTNHIVPGFMLFILFALPLSGTSIFFIQDRNAGCINRMRVSGMTNWNLIAVLFLSHGSVQLIKIVICTLLLVYGFSLTIYGPILLYIIIMVFNSACGLAIGSVLAVICANEMQALIAIFFVAAILIPFSGVLWPIEILEYHWKMIAYCLPTTLISQSFRSVVFRGVSYSHALVWPGLVAPIVWICASLSFSLFILRRY